MIVEYASIHGVGFSLRPIRAAPHRCYGINGLAVGKPCLKPEPYLSRYAHEVIDNLEPRRFRMIVHPAYVGDVVYLQIGFAFEKTADVKKLSLVYGEVYLALGHKGIRHHSPEPRLDHIYYQ